ncbi:hypothetical protein RND81_09G012600 [Saponaria officinalis]|uniref:Uncharacterized protein n=1 Tax=Saponaria officinalis TaxID=3572 RepID=A0AAW1HM33_SAPOF
MACPHASGVAGLNATEIRLISGKINSCSNGNNYADSHWDANYPSMALPTSAGAFDTVFYRTVTNVGSPRSVKKDQS